jgi:ADP-ribosylglycohydrolase
MIGALAGDIIGSIYEWNNIKTTEFELFQSECHFTDDTVLTVALAETIVTNASYNEKLRQYYSIYPDASYGKRFCKWAKSRKPKPYNSFGNGSAMRISPVGWAYQTLDDVMRKAEEFSIITHNHPEGIKGAQATAASIFMARHGSAKDEIKQYVTATFGYDLAMNCDDIRPTYCYDITCQGTVPQAVVAFLDSNGFEHAIRLAVSLGGDSDTLACITGSIAEAFYGIPETIRETTLQLLSDDLKYVTERFCAKYIAGIE